MTEPTTESHAEVQAAFDAFRHEVSEAMHVIQEYLNGRSNSAFTVSLATPSGMVNFDRFLIPEPVDPLVQMFRTLPLNGDAGCDKLTDAEWLTVANAARAELAKIGWQVGPIETPAAPEPAPVDPNHTEAVELVLALPVERTDNQKQAIRDGFAGRLQVAAALAGLKRGMELTPAKPAPAHPLTEEQVIENCALLMEVWGCAGVARTFREGRSDDKDRAFFAEYRRQTSAMTTPDVVTGDMVGRAIGQPTASPIEEHGWLIEHEDEPKWLTLRPAEASWSACWTKESSDAVRFCRRSDAEDYVSAHFGGEGPIRITDHIWTGAKP